MQSFQSTRLSSRAINHTSKLGPYICAVIVGVGASAIAPQTASAQWLSSRVDAHAPLGVMGDHRHEAGEVMLSLRYMTMPMTGSRIGTDRVSNESIVSPTGSNFLATPVKMPMQMVMAGVMYAPVDRITLNAMVPYLSNSMHHITRTGGAFTTESQGIGDISIGALVGLAKWANQAAHLNLVVSLPTGSITEQDELPTSNGAEVQLPYPMQVGSGTVDLKPGITWLGQSQRWSWGAQTMGTFRAGDNSRGWRNGNRFDATGWVGVPASKNVSFSIRGVVSSWGDVKGSDSAPSVNPSVVPTARTDLRGGTRFDAGIGANWYVYRPAGLRFAAELLTPLYQDLHGPQLENDYTLVVGMQIVAKH